MAFGLQPMKKKASDERQLKSTRGWGWGSGMYLMALDCVAEEVIEVLGA
jgi:hypothetical protein